MMPPRETGASRPQEASKQELPLVWAGPILRKVTETQVSIWMAVRARPEVELELFPEAEAEADTTTAARKFCLNRQEDGLTVLSAGRSLHYLLIDVTFDTPLPADRWIAYRLRLRFEGRENEGWLDHSVWAPDLCYPGQSLPGFQVPSKVSALLHGSCRKPHAEAKDGLVAADNHLQRCLGADTESLKDPPKWPSLLMLSGDQIYADDVAGPMLQAIHWLVERLGLPNEKIGDLETGIPETSKDLRGEGGYLYRRDELLPEIDQNTSVFEVLFGGTRKPVFTSQHARNHLITLDELLAMYVLVWSPAAWISMPSFSAPAGLDEKDAKAYALESERIRQFVEDLPACRRVFAHLPTAMIFDDHDVTDDWNLSLAWEQAAYGHPLAKRVIGNAIIAYGINQAWGNRPETFAKDIEAPLRAALEGPGTQAHDQAIDSLLDFEAWDFEWPTDPPLIVLDTRTRRWRSERNAHFPSGLLDWEAATDLQIRLRNRKAVLLVSAAPIFGVKLIETVQRFFTLIGKPLMVDAEYWMAHPGTAAAILNVFRHRDTPEHFVILSGDVHYSFVYDVELRQGKRRLNGTFDDGPEIWQICSSGIKNTWPEKLIRVLDQGNRFAFSPRSPLNWFTKRRGMRVIPRKPVGTPHGQRILNASGIGLVELDNTGAPTAIRQLTATGAEVPFERREAEARLD